MSQTNQPIIAEYYTNTISPNNPILPRYWITPKILIGGNIVDKTDWEHLKSTFGIEAVINVDPRSDLDNGIDYLLECGVNDDGNGFPREKILQVCEFANNIAGPIYLHCHLGFSRSPHFAYAILRKNYKFSKEEALKKVKGSLPSANHHWGFNQHTDNYIKSIENALQSIETGNEMKFVFRHHNRMVYPQKHLMIVEDIIHNQKRVLDHFHSIFDSDGLVQISLVPGALAASSIIEKCKIDLIILDHDLPEGNARDLLGWMKEKSIHIPVITFSGIPQNNTNMINLGATYLFQKEEVIRGDADNLIKQILTLNSGIAEAYVNKVCINQPTANRYWVTPELMIGGSIIDAADYQHLKTKYYMDGVLNVETEHSDLEKGIQNLCEVQVPDNGSPFPVQYVQKAAKFTDEFLIKNKGKSNLYVHCQMGGSRSPAFGYMVLRHHYKMSKDDALGQIRGVVPSGNWGYHPYHQSYIQSIEDGLIGIT